MKLTKWLTTEIEKFLTTYWETYFKGNLEEWANYLPEDYRNIGTTNEEIWNSRREILESKAKQGAKFITYLSVV